MKWLTNIGPIASLHVTGRHIIIIASLCGIGCFAYTMLVRRRSSNSWRRQRKLKRRKNVPLESNIFLHLAENFGLEKTHRYPKDNQQQALDDLVVTMDQLEYLLSYIKEEGLLTESADYVMSIKEKICALNNMIDSRIGRVDRRMLNETVTQKKKEDHVLSVISSSRTALPMHHGDDDYDDVKSISSDDSFVSATESIPDMIPIAMDIIYDDETRALLIQYGHLDFYKEGIEEYTNHGINVRTVRTKMLGCENDADFKVKVHCIRQAFYDLLQKDECRNWLVETGNDMLIDIMEAGEKSTIDLKRDFGVLIDYCQDQRNWVEIEEELKGREVCSMSFYDIVLDFIIMDSFDDLASPPYVLTSVLQNGWLTDSIKEAALSAAVWSLLTAKVRMLKNPNAFMAKLYQLSRHTTPILVWGLLGPSSKLKRSCTSFKDMLLGFLQDIFSLNRCNYKSKKTLSDDIISNAKQRLLQKWDL